jgi:hypothetical protein
MAAIPPKQQAAGRTAQNHPQGLATRATSPKDQQNSGSGGGGGITPPTEGQLYPIGVPTDN